MDFPPVSKLLSATFDHQNQQAVMQDRAQASQAPQPAAKSEGTSGEGEESGSQSNPEYKPDTVGAFLNESA